MGPDTPASDPCTNLLRSLGDALREAAPRLNQDLPFPQRTGITDIAAGEVHSDNPDVCSVALTICVAGGVEKRYVLSADVAGGHAVVTVSDEADFEERVALVSPPGRPLQERDVRGVYDALTTDLAGHFGTES